MYYGKIEYAQRVDFIDPLSVFNFSDIFGDFRGLA
jgi:hypothetical protein